MEIVYFEPNSIFVLLLFLGLFYLATFTICLVTIKFDVLGKLFLVVSLLLYLYVGYYMTAASYYADDKSLDIFSSYGYLELIILVYPYIFLSIACRFGEKKN